MTTRQRYALSHMELYVADMERMLAFYTDVLGFTVTDEGGAGDGRMAFLSRDPQEHHQLVLAAGRNDAPAGRVLNHISFRVADLATLREVLRQVSAAPHGPVEQVTHGISWSVYFRDPEGNRLECFVDTPWYTPQPCREPMDFTQPDRQIYAATESLVRGRPGFQTREDWRQGLAAHFANA